MTAELWQAHTPLHLPSTLVISGLRSQEAGGSLSLRLVWSLEQVLGQPRLSLETLFQKQNNKQTQNSKTKPKQKTQQTRLEFRIVIHFRLEHLFALCVRPWVLPQHCQGTNNRKVRENGAPFSLLLLILPFHLCLVARKVLGTCRFSGVPSHPACVSCLTGAPAHKHVRVMSFRRWFGVSEIISPTGPYFITLESHVWIPQILGAAGYVHEEPSLHFLCVAVCSVSGFFLWSPDCLCKDVLFMCRLFAWKLWILG